MKYSTSFLMFYPCIFFILTKKVLNQNIFDFSKVDSLCFNDGFAHLSSLNHHHAPGKVFSWDIIFSDTY